MQIYLEVAWHRIALLGNEHPCFGTATGLIAVVAAQIANLGSFETFFIGGFIEVIRGSLAQVHYQLSPHHALSKAFWLQAVLSSSSNTLSAWQ